MKRGVGGVMAPTWIRLKCGECKKEVYVTPGQIELRLVHAIGSYAFTCIHGCGHREQPADPWMALQLYEAGVVLVVSDDQQEGDQMAADLRDDAAIAEEIDGWDE